MAEYLFELDAQKSLEALQNCYSQKSILIFKSSSSNHVLRARIESFVDRKVILKFDNLASDIDLNEVLSIKFNVGTEVFFVKTSLKKFLTQYYFDLTVQVIELRRRKQTRYEIPKKWKQNAALPKTYIKEQPVLCRILDLSLTGLRIEVVANENLFQIDQILEVQFQIHQRASIACQTIIRFIKANPNNSICLGLEFLPLNAAQVEKISSLLEDLKNFIALDKS